MMPPSLNTPMANVMRKLLCHAQVKWHSQWQEIDVALSEDEDPALGTRLLKGCVMTMNFIDNTLTIDKPLR